MAGPLRIAQNRDLLEEARTKIIKTGPIYESAVDEFLQLYVAAAQFKLEGDEWIDHETRVTLDEAVLKYAEDHAHSYANRREVAEELEANEIDDAMMQPTPDKVSRLAIKLGDRAFKKICADYQFDVRRMTTPGTRPVYAADGSTVVKKKAAPGNPWSAANFNITKQGELVRQLGPEKAAAIARAAGCKLGDTKPNPHYN